MYKIKIFPAIKIEHLPFFLEKIKEGKLIGCPVEIHNNRYYLLNNISHRVNDIISVGDDMCALIEFTDTKIGNHMRSLINGLGEDSSYLKQFFINETNLGLNIYPINDKIIGVVL
jgi:hypothetical protein